MAAIFCCPFAFPQTAQAGDTMFTLAKAEMMNYTEQYWAKEEDEAFKDKQAKPTPGYLSNYLDATWRDDYGRSLVIANNYWDGSWKDSGTYMYQWVKDSDGFLDKPGDYPGDTVSDATNAKYRYWGYLAVWDVNGPYGDAYWDHDDGYHTNDLYIMNDVHVQELTYSSGDIRVSSGEHDFSDDDDKVRLSGDGWLTSKRVWAEGNIVLDGEAARLDANQVWANGGFAVAYGKAYIGEQQGSISMKGNGIALCDNAVLKVGGVLTYGDIINAATNGFAGFSVEKDVRAEGSISLKLKEKDEYGPDGELSVGGLLSAGGKIQIQGNSESMVLNAVSSDNDSIFFELGEKGELTINGVLTAKEGQAVLSGGTFRFKESGTISNTTGAQITNGAFVYMHKDLSVRNLTVEDNSHLAVTGGVSSTNDINISGSTLSVSGGLTSLSGNIVLQEVKDAGNSGTLTLKSIAAENGKVSIKGKESDAFSAQDATYVSAENGVKAMSLNLENAFVTAYKGDSEKALALSTAMELTNSILYVEETELHVNSVLLNGARLEVYVTVGVDVLHPDLVEIQEGTLTLSKLTMAGSSYLGADLVVASGGSLSFAENAVLTMGCSVSLSSDTALTIGGDANAAPVLLFNSVEELVLNGDAVTEGFYDAADVLLTLNGESITHGQYFLCYQNGDVSITNVPEPATATLSLLALVALTARRKRK